MKRDELIKKIADMQPKSELAVFVGSIVDPTIATIYYLKKDLNGFSVAFNNPYLISINNDISTDEAVAMMSNSKFKFAFEK